MSPTIAAQILTLKRALVCGWMRFMSRACMMVVNIEHMVPLSTEYYVNGSHLQCVDIVTFEKLNP
jgi:hypothetical protein